MTTTMKTRCVTCNSEIFVNEDGDAEHVDAGAAANCADIRGDLPIEGYTMPVTKMRVENQPDGTALLYDGTLLIGRIRRRAKPLIGFADRSAELQYSVEGTAYIDQRIDDRISEDRIWCSIGSSSRIETPKPLTPETRRAALDAAAAAWPFEDDGKYGPEAADAYAEIRERMGQPIEPSALQAALMAMSRVETTIRLTVSLRAADGFDVESVTDRDSDDLEGDQPTDLADHLALYVGAALDGLYDRQHRSLALKYVVVADEIPGDA